MDRTTSRLRPIALYVLTLALLFLLTFLAGRLFRPGEDAPTVRDPHGHQPTAASLPTTGAYPAPRFGERR